MSGTDTAIAELNESTAEHEAATAPPRPAALPYLSVAECPRRHRAGTSTPSARRSSASCTRWMTAASGTQSCRSATACSISPMSIPSWASKRLIATASSVSLMLHVADTDATLERARERGATVQREAYENYGARNATIIDPFGHRWMLSGPVTGAPIQIQHGDVGYISVWTPDADRAAAFYGARARLDLRPADPSGHQHQGAHRHLLRRRAAHAVLLLRGGRPRGRAAGDPGRWRNGRRTRAVRLRHAQWRHRPAGYVVRRLPAEPGPAAA